MIASATDAAAITAATAATATGHAAHRRFQPPPRPQLLAIAGGMEATPHNAGGLGILSSAAAAAAALAASSGAAAVAI